MIGNRTGLFENKSQTIQFFLFCITCLFSLELLAASSEPVKFHVVEFQMDGSVPVDAELIDSTLEPHQNKEHTIESLLAVTKTLEKAIRDQGFSFYRIVLPQQSIGKDGAVSLRVVSFTLGSISVKGNEHFNEANIRNSLPALVIGESTNTEDAANELQVATRHPVKDLRLTFKQSNDVDQIDAVLNVSDAKPENFAVILANTGSSSTGDYRLTGSYQHTNLWNKDHIFNASYTTSPGHYSDVKQYGSSYSAPIYSQRAWLTGYFVRSDVSTGMVGALDISGAGKMMGLHYLKSLKRIGTYKHWLDVGIDNKLFENDILFGMDSLVPDVRSAPVSVMYKGEFPWRDYNLDFYLQFNTNTGFGSDNNDMTYASNRTNADRSWDLVRYGMSVNHPFKGWGLKGVLAGQYSSEALISGEQFGLGGSGSIRGYEEREIAKDKGISFKFEAISPKYKQANFVGFFDSGTGSSNDVQPGDPSRSQTIASIGAGIRWQYERSILIRVDLAHALKDGAAGQTQSGDNKIHGTVILNF